MAFFVPAIMALAHGAAAAGTAAGQAAGTAGAAVGHGAMAAGSAIGHGAETVGSDIGKGAQDFYHGEGLGNSSPAISTPSASMPAAGGVSVPSSAASTAAKSPSFIQTTTHNALKDQVNGGFSSVLGGAMKSSPVPSTEPGSTIQNPIAPSPSFGGNEIGGTSMPMMQGVMSNPFGASSQKALTDSLSRNG